MKNGAEGVERIVEQVGVKEMIVLVDYFHPGIQKFILLRNTSSDP